MLLFIGYEIQAWSTEFTHTAAEVSSQKLQAAHTSNIHSSMQKTLASNHFMNAYNNRAFKQQQDASQYNVALNSDTYDTTPFTTITAILRS